MIRAATLADIPVIQMIANQTWPDAYGAIISKEQLTYMLEMMYSSTSLKNQMEKGHQFYLFEIDQQPIGFASVSNEGAGIYKLNKLYVLPTTQKTGAGKALLQKSIEHASNAGGQQLILQVNKLNSAKQFYERHGFTVLEEKVLELEHGFVMDDYIMGISL
ncbi:MAG: GNAT family N-acetyltransferase [Sediminibacterium sp.]|nr:GNAT family N-acetyltransferase [Sediminibacterium sp.]